MPIVDRWDVASSTYARTKIVATVGPASSHPDTLRQLVNAGVDVFRLNMAHGTLEDHEAIIRSIRAIEHETYPLAILVDLAGTKLRLDELLEDPYLCELDAEITLQVKPATQPHEFFCRFEPIVQLADIGEEILLGDGDVRLVVVQKEPQQLICRVVDAGIARSRQGVNLMGTHRELPALTPRDRELVPWAAQQQADYLSLSFVQSPDDVDELRSITKSLDFACPIIAKIEKRGALQKLEQVIEAADGIMVARGDLGLEVDIAQVPVLQKQIVELCNNKQKPVIVATEMLDSMQHSQRPTRAEVTDVANAILDGADACMLSGETAIGSYPVQTVATMNRIMLNTEQLLQHRPSRPHTRPNYTGSHPVTSAVVYGAGQIAAAVKARLVVITTRSGLTALTKSQQRDNVPTVAVSADSRVLRRMALYNGVQPLAGAPSDDFEALRSFIFDWGRRHGILCPGDPVVFVAGRATGQIAHNSVSVYAVPFD